MMEKSIGNMSFKALLKQAQDEAGHKQGGALSWLYENSDLSSQQVTDSLAEHYFYQAMSFEQIKALTPAFDKLSFSEAIQKNCLLLHDQQEQLMFVFADVFDHTLHSWLVEKLTVPFRSFIAHQNDIKAYLTVQEESMRAVDSTLAGDVQASQAGQKKL
jgi:general secretion pathway protein E